MQGLQGQLAAKSQELMLNGVDFQQQFVALVMKHAKRKNSAKNYEAQTPKMHKGTVKRYLTDLQNSLLQLLKKQLLGASSATPHPIRMVCDMFVQEFGQAASKYVKPEENKAGVLDKAKLIVNYQERTDELIREFSKVSASHNFTSFIESNAGGVAEATGPTVQDINLTNQLVGEVQLFIFTMRWVIYEFYQFKKLKKEKLLVSGDFEALEDDIVFIIHKLVMKEQVLKAMIVLNRLFKNKLDKDIRKKYKLIAENQSAYFPIESGDSEETLTPALREILMQCKKSREVPFKKAVIEFQTIMGSPDIPPLDKLYKL